MKTTAQYTFEPTYPDKMVFTASVTMTLGEWKKVRAALLAPEAALSLVDFSANIADMVRKCEEKHYITEAEGRLDP